MQEAPETRVGSLGQEEPLEGEMKVQRPEFGSQATFSLNIRASLVAQMVKNLPAMQKTQV